MRHGPLITWTAHSGITHLVRVIEHEDSTSPEHEVLCGDNARGWRVASVGDLSVVVTCLWCATTQELR